MSVHKAGNAAANALLELNFRHTSTDHDHFDEQLFLEYSEFSVPTRYDDRITAQIPSSNMTIFARLLVSA